MPDYLQAEMDRIETLPTVTEWLEQRRTHAPIEIKFDVVKYLRAEREKRGRKLLSLISKSASKPRA